MSEPLVVREETVPKAWVDYNGHMRDGFYVVAFSEAIDALMDRIGLDAAYRERTGGTLYSGEVHVVYLREVAEGVRFAIDVQILDHDAKRLHLFLRMRDATGGDLLATEETMQLHVDQNAGPAVAPFPPEASAHIAALAKAQQSLARPEQAGRVIAIRRR